MDGAAWLLIALAIAGPFIVLIVGLAFGSFYVFRNSKQHLIRFKNKKTQAKQIGSASKKTHFLYWAMIILIVLGWILLIKFALDGGPNEGMGKHIFNSAENPYLDMQVGFAFTIIGVCVVVGMEPAKIRKANKRKGQPTGRRFSPKNSRY